MHFKKSLEKHTTTSCRGVRQCVHNLHTLSQLIHYQLNSCLRSRYVDYKPESFKNVLFRHCFTRSKRLAALPPASKLQITSDQFDLAHVWLTLRMPQELSANVIQASHAVVGDDLVLNAAH
jgi:hypothetical protein